MTEIITTQNYIQRFIETDENLEIALDNIKYLFKKAKFKSNEFDSFNSWIILEDINKKFRVDEFLASLFSFIPLKDKKLTERLSLYLEVEEDVNHLRIVLDKTTIGYFNYHEIYKDDYPSQWFDVSNEKDLKYIIIKIIDYSFKDHENIKILIEILKNVKKETKTIGL